MKLNLDFSKLKPQHIPMLMALQNNYQLTLRGEKGSKLTIEELDDNFRFFLDNIGTISGTASEIAYFGQDGFLTSDSGFTRTEDTTQILHTFWTPNYPQFSGNTNWPMVGIAANGYYTGPTNSVYTIIISATGPNDFFDWSDNTGASGSNIEINSGNGNLLDSEVGVYFPNSNGHDIGDTWTFDMIEIESFHVNGDAIGNGGIVNATFDQTNNIASINLLGNATGRPNGALYGLINQQTGDQGLVNITSFDGISFRVDIYAGDGNNGSQLKMDAKAIGFNFSSGDEYYFPTTNGSGPLVNDGAGNLSFTTGFSGTYSTGEGMIVTVTNGIIMSVG